jgi:hypothetical protein
LATNGAAYDRRAVCCLPRVRLPTAATSAKPVVALREVG